MLLNITGLLQTARMEAIALVFKATLNFHQRGIKSNEQKQKYLLLLEKAFKDISCNIVRSTLKVKIKSIAHMRHHVMLI